MPKFFAIFFSIYLRPKILFINLLLLLLLLKQKKVKTICNGDKTFEPPCRFVPLKYTFGENVTELFLHPLLPKPSSQFPPAELGEHIIKWSHSKYFPSHNFMFYQIYFKIYYFFFTFSAFSFFWGERGEGFVKFLLKI